MTSKPLIAATRAGRSRAVGVVAAWDRASETAAERPGAEGAIALRMTTRTMLERNGCPHRQPRVS